MIHAAKGILQNERLIPACGDSGPTISSVEFDKIDCVACLRIQARKWLDAYGREHDSHFTCYDDD